MSFAAVAGGLAAGAVGVAGSSLLGGGGASGAASAADPFAGQRGQYQTMLSNLINNPSSITSQPGYQFELDQSNKAVEGSAAANGMVNSGNVLQALSTNSQGFAAQQLNNQELLLAQLAGANVGSPGEAGAILQGQNTANQGAISTLGSQIGTAVTNGFNTGFGSTGSENVGASSTSTPDDLISGYGS